MTQILQSPNAVPVLQMFAAAAAAQMLFQSPLTSFFGQQLAELTAELQQAARNVIFHSPVIAISAGVTYFVQENITSFAVSADAASSLKVVAVVAGILALRAALSTYLARSEGERRDSYGTFERFNKTLVNNFVPIALGTVATYYAGIPVKLVETALYTAALIPAVKLVGKGCEYLLEVKPVNELVTGVFNLWN